MQVYCISAQIQAHLVLLSYQQCFFSSTVKPEANAPISRNVDVSGSSSPFGGCSHQEHSSLALDGLYSRAVWGLTHADEKNAWPSLPEVSDTAWHRTSPWKVRAVPGMQPRCRNSGGVASGKQCTSGALRLCQAWDVISFFHSQNCCSLEKCWAVSLFFTPPWLCTMPCLYLWLQQQEAAECRDEDQLTGMAETWRCETGRAGLKSRSLKSGRGLRFQQQPGVALSLSLGFCLVRVFFHGCTDCLDPHYPSMH